MSLKQVIECAYALSDAILEDYESLSRLVVRAMRSRCRPPTAEENCVDGTLSAVEAAYSIELYLRWLYLSLKEQSFDVNDEQSVQYIGSRQQCLYGCVCFTVMFFEMYSKFDAIGMKNVDWLTCIVLDSGCSELNR